MARDPFESAVDQLPTAGSSVSAVRDPFETAASQLPVISPARRFVQHPVLSTASALAKLPYKEVILPTLGAFAGAIPEVGPEASSFLQALSRFSRIPAASTIGAAAGGGVAGALEEARQAQELGRGALVPGAGGRIAFSSAISAPFGASPGIAKAPGAAREMLAASKLHRQIDVTGGFEKAAPRLQFLRNIIGEVSGVPRESGEAVGAALDTLQAAHPDRAPALTGKIIGELGKIREDIKRTPGLQPAIQQAAKFTGSTDVIDRLFPEFALTERLTPEERGKIGLVTQQGIGFAPPSDITLDEAQRLKRVMARVAFARPSTPVETISATRLQAMEIWGRIREHELSVHPELEQEFLRHHAVMANFREVMPFLVDPAKLISGLKTLFAGDPAAQVGFKELLKESPATLRQLRHFATATSLQQAKRATIWRAMRYLIFLPYFRLSSMMFRQAFQRK